MVCSIACIGIGTIIQYHFARNMMPQLNLLNGKFSHGNLYNFQLIVPVNDNCQSMFVIITSTSLKSVVNQKVG